MKQEKNTETKAESQAGQGIKDALTGMYNKIINYIAPPVTHSNHLRSGQGSGFCIGKAPPGSARSPGAARGHPPAPKSALRSPFLELVERSKGRRAKQVLSIKKNTMNINTLIKKQILIFYKHLIFKIMKKQILILVFLVVAIFASVTESMAQPWALPSVTAPSPLGATALTDPLAPIAGRAYDYSVTFSPAGGTTYWYATNATTFITAGARVAAEIPADGTKILATATNYKTTVSGAGATSPSTTQVTWTSAGLAGINATTAPLFMVAEMTGPTCTNDNMKVYQIIPKNAFTVDITNMVHTTPFASLAYGVAETQCFADVASATWASATGITIDYGINKMYFEIIAANFTATYKPTLRLTGLAGTQTADIKWGVAIGTYDQTVVTATNVSPYTSAQLSVSTQKTINETATGVSIYVEVTIHNNGYEGLSDVPIELAVEAVDNSTPALADIDPDLVTITSYGDAATQTLNLRPSITAVPATGAFLPQVP